jgi:predicted phosphodiesterase
MERRNFLRNIGLLTAVAAVPVGNVFANRSSLFAGNAISGTVTSNGKGIANVVVSDGYNLVLTDKNGRYNFEAHYNAEFVFVSTPAGHEFDAVNGIANFYKKIDKSNSKQTLDFALSKLKQADDKHAFIIWGDTQIQSKEDAELLKTISVPDTKAVAASLASNVPVHAIAVGDLVFDKFDLFEDYKQAVASIGIPFFQVIGNHDMDYTARTDDGSQATFKSHFGPTYYSFNRGKIHYIVLDDVFFIGNGHRYIGYLTENQLSWLEKDLQHVPKGSTVVVSLHIPTNTSEARRAKGKEESFGGSVSNKQALYDLLKPYKVHIMSGHTHYNENWEKDNIMEHNHGTVCGAWWTGPICGDGTPSGYGVYEVDGNEIEWHYKSVGFDKENQIAVHKKGAMLTKPNAVAVNVWNHDDKWTVEWFEDGVAKGKMERICDVDPAAVQLYKGPALPIKHKWVEPNLTDHLFIATPSSTAKELKIKVTDRFGKVYEQKMDLA